MKSPVVQGNGNNPCWNLSHNWRVLGKSLLSRAKSHCSFTCSPSSAAVCYSWGQGQQKGSAEARAELWDVWMRFNRRHKKPLNKSQHTKAHGRGSSAARLCQGAAGGEGAITTRNWGDAWTGKGPIPAAGLWALPPYWCPVLLSQDIILYSETFRARSQKIHSNHLSHTCLTHHPSHITTDYQETRTNSGLLCFLRRT